MLFPDALGKPESFSMKAKVFFDKLREFFNLTDFVLIGNDG